MPVVTAAALIVGLGAGWLAFGASAEALPSMPANQAETLAELEKDGDYDAGSLRYLGEREGASVWRGTTENGTSTCIAMTVEGRSARSCRPIDEATDGQNPLAVSIDVPDGDTQWMFWATVAEDITGREAVIVQRMGMTYTTEDWTTRFRESEVEIARALDEEGIDLTRIEIIGYDESTPVWINYMPEMCVYVVNADTGVASVCEPSGGDDPLVLEVGATTYTIDVQADRGPSLTVTKRVEVPDAG